MNAPLNPLRVFDVAARYGNITRAASELNVTQSAVSRQIAVLEGYLGVQLFVRCNEGVRLTDVGRTLHEEISPAFQIIQSAAGRVRKNKTSGPFRVLVSKIFAVNWLMGRLPSFEAKHPSIRVELSHSLRPVNFEQQPVDLAIQYGLGEWRGVCSERILPDILQPVCSPRLLSAGPPIKTVADLANHHFLQSRFRPHDWSDWLAAAGYPDLKPKKESEYTSSIIAHQALVEGTGIAIGQKCLLERDLDAGALVALFDMTLERREGYYCVWPDKKPLSPPARAFVNWLRDQAAHSRQRIEAEKPRGFPVQHFNKAMLPAAKLPKLPALASHGEL